VIGLSYFTWVFLLARPLIWYHDLDLWPLSLTFSKTLTGHNFWLVGGRAFIFHMCIPSDKAFHLIPWPSPSDRGVWPLQKTLTLVTTFHWMVVGLSYFLWQDLSFDTTTFTTWPLILEFDLFFQNFNLGHNFWLDGGRTFIFHMCIPSGKAFHLIPWPWPSDRGVWPLQKL
jgi:hypothetical protein